MTDRANGRKAVVFVLIVAVFLLCLCAVPVISAAPAKGTWLSRSRVTVGVAAGAGSALLLKKNLENRQGEQFGILNRSYDAFEKGDKRKLDAVSDESRKIPGRLMVDQLPLLKVGTFVNEKYQKAKRAVTEKLQNAKRRIKRWFGRDSEIDHGLALAPVESGSERELLGRKPLPKPRKIRFSRRTLPAIPDGNPGAAAWGAQDAPRARVASKPAHSSSFEEWVKEEQRARPNCYGIVSDAAAAECESDSWDGKWNARKPEKPLPSQNRDDQRDKARRDYEAALSRAVGENTGTSGSGDYRDALNDLEVKEKQAREATERLTRQAAVENEAAEERRRYEAQREVERRRETARRQAETVRKNQMRAIQSINQTIRNSRRSYSGGSYYRGGYSGGYSSRKRSTKEPKERSYRSYRSGSGTGQR